MSVSRELFERVFGAAFADESNDDPVIAIELSAGEVVAFNHHLESRIEFVREDRWR